MAILVAGLSFLAVVTLVLGLFWAWEARQGLRERLRWTQPAAPDILKVAPGQTRSEKESLLARSPLVKQLTVLLRQAGRNERPANWASIIGLFGLVGGILGWLRTGGLLWGLLLALMAGSLPVVYLIYKRHQRLQQFQLQFPDALDMMSRALRTGYALSGTIQLVGEEMPDPVGEEFRRVFEETRLGLDPVEALAGLRSRASTEDLNFFCTAVTIQRTAGGNLTEILDRLSEVIRERFKLMSHIRALSAQHKWSAVCVGLFPLVFAMIFQLMNPRYFDPLWASPHAPMIIGAGILFEAIGFFMIWRIAQIKV